MVIQEQAARIKKLTQADEEMPALLGMQGPYVLDLKGYDPAGQAKLLGTPMLILQGERDFQVNMKDFAAWKNGLKGMTRRNPEELSRARPRPGARHREKSRN